VPARRTAAVEAPPADPFARMAEEVFGDDATLNRKELADRLGVGHDTIKTACEEGRLHEVRVSARRLVTTREHVAAYLRSINVEQ
jgi:hypothetical protein